LQWKQESQFAVYSRAVFFVPGNSIPTNAYLIFSGKEFPNVRSYQWNREVVQLRGKLSAKAEIPGIRSSILSYYRGNMSMLFSKRNRH
jgi:hypothetical protein